MAKITKAKMAELIDNEQAELAEDIAKGMIRPEHAQRITGEKRMDLADMAEREGHTDLAQPLRRAIGD